MNIIEFTYGLTFRSVLGQDAKMILSQELKAILFVMKTCTRLYIIAKKLFFLPLLVTSSTK